MDPGAAANATAESEAPPSGGPQGNRRALWALLSLAAVGVVVALVVVALRPPEGDELDLSALFALADEGRVEHATVHDGKGYVTGEYVRPDGTVASYYTRVDDADDEAMGALIERVVFEAKVPLTVRSRPPLIELVAFVAAVGTAVLVVAVVVLMLAWRRGWGPFGSPPPSAAPPGPGVPPPAGVAGAGPPAAHGQPGAAVAVQARREHPPAGVAALICGVLAFVVPIPLVLSIAAVVLGLNSREAAAAEPHRFTDELGTAGRVLGWIGIVLQALVGLVVGLGIAFAVFAL